MRTSPLHQGQYQRRTVKRGEFFYSMTTAPAVEPVTLAEAKLFCRIDTDADDALVTALIIAARQTVEKQTGRALIEQSWAASLDRLPNALTFELAYRPIMSVTSIRAYNDDDTFDSIDVSTGIVLDGANGRISLKDSAAAIVGDRPTNVYQIVYKAGYGATAASAPEWAKLAIKQTVAHWYEHRGDSPEKAMASIPFGAKMLIDQNCVIEL